MSLNSVLVDSARRVVDTPLPGKVEGSTRFTTLHEPWFRCRLTLLPAPQSDDAQGGHVRIPRNGTLLVGRRDRDGNVLAIEASDRLEVSSRDLGSGMFDVTGAPEPIRKKRKLIGWMASIVRVEEDEFIRALP